MSADVLDVPQAQNQGNEEWGQGAQRTNLELICTKLENPNYQAGELMRLVTLEMVMVVAHMLRLGRTVEENYIARGLGEIIKALRELRHSIMDTELLRKRADVINWEGEAIKHLVATLEDWFVEALKEAGLGDYDRSNVMRSLRDIANINEPQLRRELKALGG